MMTHIRRLPGPGMIPTARSAEPSVSTTRVRGSPYRPLVCALLYLGLATTACGAAGPFGPLDREALNRARDLWNARMPASYRYEFRQTCFCDPQLLRWHEVLVSGDSVQSVTPLDSVPGVAPSPRPLNLWPTVPGLFAIIERSAAEDYTKRVTATYDPDLGYPTMIDVVCRDNVADCGVTFEARKLRPAP